MNKARSKIKAIIKRPDEKIGHMTWISPTLENLQKHVDGYIETVNFGDMIILCDEEGRLKTETIQDLHLEKSWNGCARRIEKFGNTGSMPVRKYFPFLAMENSEDGTFIGFLMGHASSWQIEFSCKETQDFDVMGGIADRDMGHWMKKLRRINF